MEGNIEIKRYNPDLKELWDDFVESSKNGTFLFKRDYMDYHSDRFQDHSFLIYRKGKLYCLLPANIREDTLYSHQGLTYGGLVMSNKCTTQGILDVFEFLLKYISKESIKYFIYKPIPYIYSCLPAQEDLYALFRNEAVIIVRNVSTTIFRPDSIKFIKDRRAAIRKAIANEVLVKESKDYISFWNILNQNLSTKYGTSSVHSLKEIELLASRFPDNIKLFSAYKNEKMIGGVVCYITKKVVHTQYISADPYGKSIGAIDLIIDHLLNQEFIGIPYFDFGISNEDNGRYLNQTLIYQKEGFGGRAVCYDTYQITL